MEREEPLPAFAGRAGARGEQEIGFRSEPEQRRAEDGALPFPERVLSFCSAALQGGILHFRIRQSQTCRAKARRYIFVSENKLGNEERVAQIRQRVVKALRRMNGP